MIDYCAVVSALNVALRAREVNWESHDVVMENKDKDSAVCDISNMISCCMDG